MNLPNKLTMLRMFMIPLFLVFYFVDSVPMHYLWAFIVFAAASLTDLLDGKIARKYGLITDFGKLMDPLADKLLVVSALCCILPDYGVIGIISLILILSREFLVTSIRLIAAGKGEVLAADIWGKVKTVVQMVWICFVLIQPMLDWVAQTFFMQYTAVDEITQIGSLPPGIMLIYTVCAYALLILFALMVAITVASGVHYIIKNRKLFADA